MTKEDAVIKMDVDIYEKIKDIVEANQVEYPSIKNFIEKAVLEKINFHTYNIEGISHGKSIVALPLNNLINSTKNFTQCLLCEKMFLKNKNDKSEGSRLCQNCKNTINYFKRKI